MDELISYLKVEIKRIERIIDGDYLDLIPEFDYRYEQGRVDAFSYVLDRINDTNKEEEE